MHGVTRRFYALRRKSSAFASEMRFAPEHDDGPAAIRRRLDRFEKRAGEQVIITHRFLKSSISATRHIAAGDSLVRLLDAMDDHPPELLTSTARIGNIGLALPRPQPADQTN